MWLMARPSRSKRQQRIRENRETCTIPCERGALGLQPRIASRCKQYVFTRFTDGKTEGQDFEKSRHEKHDPPLARADPRK